MAEQQKGIDSSSSQSLGKRKEVYIHINPCQNTLVQPNNKPNHTEQIVRTAECVEQQSF
jgi:hypothetical protein